MSWEIIKNALEWLDQDTSNVSESDKKKLQSLLESDKWEVNAMMIDAIKRQHPWLLDFLKWNKENILNTLKDFLETNPSMNDADKMWIAYLIAVTQEWDYQKVDKDSLGWKTRWQQWYLQSQQQYLNNKISWLQNTYTKVNNSSSNSSSDETLSSDNTLGDLTWGWGWNQLEINSSKVAEIIWDWIDDVVDITELNEIINTETNKTGNQLLEEIFDELKGNITDQEELQKNLKKAVNELKNIKDDVKNITETKIKWLVNNKKVTAVELSALATLVTANEGKIMLKAKEAQNILKEKKVIETNKINIQNTINKLSNPTTTEVNERLKDVNDLNGYNDALNKLATEITNINNWKEKNKQSREQAMTQSQKVFREMTNKKLAFVESNKTLKSTRDELEKTAKLAIDAMKDKKAYPQVLAAANAWSVRAIKEMAENRQLRRALDKKTNNADGVYDSILFQAAALGSEETIRKLIRNDLRVRETSLNTNWNNTNSTNPENNNWNMTWNKREKSKENNNSRETLSNAPTQLYQPRNYTNQLSNKVWDRDANLRRKRLEALTSILDDETDTDKAGKNIYRAVNREWYNRMVTLNEKWWERMTRTQALSTILKDMIAAGKTKDQIAAMSKDELRSTIRSMYPDMRNHSGWSNSNRLIKKMSGVIEKMDTKDMEEVMLMSNLSGIIATGNSVEQNRLLQKELTNFESNSTNLDVQKSFLNTSLLSVCDFDANGTVDSKYIGTAVSESQLYEIFLHAKPRPNYKEENGQFVIMPGPQTNRLLAKILTTASIVSTNATPEFTKAMKEYSQQILVASNSNQNAEALRLFSQAVIENPIIRDAFKTAGENKLEAHFTDKSAKAGDATLMDDISLQDKIGKLPYRAVFGQAEAQAMQEKYLSTSIDLSNLPAWIDKDVVMKSTAYDIVGVMNTVTDMIYLKTQWLDPAKAWRMIEGIFKSTFAWQVGVWGTLSIPLDKDGKIARNNPTIKNTIGEYVRKKLQITPNISMSQNNEVVVWLGIGTEHISDDFSNRFERWAGGWLNLKDLTTGWWLTMERTRQINPDNKKVTSTFNNAAVTRLWFGLGISLPNPDIQVWPVREKDVLGGIEQRKQNINSLYAKTVDMISLTPDAISTPDELKAAIIASAGTDYQSNRSLFDAIADMATNALEADQFFSTTDVTAEEKIAYAKAIIIWTAKDRAAFLESNAIKDLNGEVKITKVKGTFSATDALLAAGVAIPWLNVLAATWLGLKKTIQLVGSVRLSAFKAQYTADKWQLAYIDKQMQEGRETRWYVTENTLEQHAQNIQESLMIPGLEVKTVDGKIQLFGEWLKSLKVLAKKTEEGKQYAYDGTTLTLGKIGEYQAATTLWDKGKKSILILWGKWVSDTEAITNKDATGIEWIEYVEKFKPLDQAKYTTMINGISDAWAKEHLNKIKIWPDGKITSTVTATATLPADLTALLGQKIEPGSQLNLVKNATWYTLTLTPGAASPTGEVKLNYKDTTSLWVDQALNISPDKLNFWEEFAEAEALLSQINPHELYNATIRNPTAYKAFLSSNMSGWVDSADLIKPLLTNIVWAEDNADATTLSTYINTADAKTKEYISIRFKQLSAMSNVTQDKSDVTPAQKTELTAAINTMPATLDDEKLKITSLINHSTAGWYTWDFLKIDRQKVVKEWWAEGKRLLFALRPINETMDMRWKTTWYDTLKKKYLNSWNEVSGFGKAIESAPSWAKNAILKARSEFMKESGIVDKSNWTKKVETNLVWVSAFYRWTNAHKEMGMTIPWAVTTVDGKLIDIASDKQKDVKDRFISSHLNNNPNIKTMYLAWVAKNISEQVKSKVPWATDITPEQAEALINWEEVKIWDITISGLETTMKFYAMGECANESVGMQLGKFKLTKPWGKEENVSAVPDKEKYHKLAWSEVLSAIDMDIKGKERQISVTGVTEVNAGRGTPNLPEKDLWWQWQWDGAVGANGPGRWWSWDSGVGPNIGDATGPKK